MGNNFDGNVPDDSITLPNDWRAAGGAVLVRQRSCRRWRARHGRGPLGHPRRPGDDRGSRREQRLPGSPPAGSIDAVDNCYARRPGNDQDGPFSNIYGVRLRGIGPFDPLLPACRSCRTARRTPAMPRCLRSALTCGSRRAVSVVWRRPTRTTSTSATRRFRTARPHNLYAPVLPGPASRRRCRATTARRRVSPGRSRTTSRASSSRRSYDYWDARPFRDDRDDPLRDRNVCRDELGQLPHVADRCRSRGGVHGRARRGVRRVQPEHRVQLRSRLERRCDLDLPGEPLVQLATSPRARSIRISPSLWDQANKTSNTLIEDHEHRSQQDADLRAEGSLRDVLRRDDPRHPRPSCRGCSGSASPARLQRPSSEPDAPLGEPRSTSAAPQKLAAQLDGTRRPTTVSSCGQNSCGQAGVLVTETRNICVDVLAENLGTRFDAADSTAPSQTPASGVRSTSTRPPGTLTAAAVTARAAAARRATAPTAPTAPTGRRTEQHRQHRGQHGRCSPLRLSNREPRRRADAAALSRRRRRSEGCEGHSSRSATAAHDQGQPLPGAPAEEPDATAQGADRPRRQERQGSACRDPQDRDEPRRS